MKVFSIVLIGLILAGCEGESPDQAPPAPEFNLVEQSLIDGKATEVQIAAIDFEYEQNELAADELFKGRVLIVNGRVVSVSKNESGVPVVRLRDLNLDVELLAFFPKTSASQLLEISRGENLRVAGLYDGRFFGAYYLKNSQLY